MTSRWLSLAVLLLGGLSVLAQQPIGQQAPPPPPPPPQLDPANNKLDALLVTWERAMADLNSLHASVKRTAIDKVFLSKEIYEGEAKYMKPNKASLWLVSGDPKKNGDYEKLVCNGQVAYKWEPLKKEIHIYELPKAKPGQVSDDNFVSMLFGMKALEAKRRYVLELLPPDANYNYIMVLPRDPQDKSEFTRARLALNIKTNLPAQIWFEQPNGNETTWDFPRMLPNAQINPAEFNQPTPDAGWQLKRVAAAEQPRVIRPQDGK